MREMPLDTEGATMKISLISIGVAAAICAGAFGTGRALATTSHQSATKTVNIVMHDPGCHSLLVHRKSATKDIEKAIRVNIVNPDEAGQKAACRHRRTHLR